MDNQENTTFNAEQPQQTAPQQTYEPKPDNNLVWAILTTILCCLPFGIVSIVYAAKVDGLWTSGQHAEARAAANSAKTWAIAAAVCGLVGSLIYICFIGCAGVMASL